jgi:hypothetical protein
VVSVLLALQAVLLDLKAQLGLQVQRVQQVQLVLLVQQEQHLLLQDPLDQQDRQEQLELLVLVQRDQLVLLDNGILLKQ